MDERRRLERFDLHTSTNIEIMAENGSRNTFSLTTKDISCGGAFIRTPEPLPEGQPVKLELLLSLETLQKVLGQKGKAKIKVKGKVIRCESGGMAIQFDRRYKILAYDEATAN